MHLIIHQFLKFQITEQFPYPNLSGRQVFAGALRRQRELAPLLTILIPERHLAASSLFILSLYVKKTQISYANQVIKKYASYFIGIIFKSSVFTFRTSICTPGESLTLESPSLASQALGFQVCSLMPVLLFTFQV